MEKRIRRIEHGDAPAIRAIYAPFVASGATSFEVEVPDVASLVRRMDDLQETHPWLVLEAGGEVLGYAYASPHRTRKAYQWCVEVSAYVAERARGRGVGRALYVSLLEILRRQGYVNAYAGITVPNPASVGFHEALEFRLIGVYERIGYKLGRWHDVAWYQRRVLEVEDPPAEPRALAPVLEDARVVALMEDAARAAALP
jgi:phosphinothricin acetyltransferase